jgi:hypothetical protein
MAPKGDAGKIPARKLPDIKISKEQIERMKTTSAILEMLSDNPELMKRIAELYLNTLMVKREERIAATIELKQRVTAMVADAMKKVPADLIDKYYPHWSNIIVKSFINLWIPHNIQYWADQGPIFSERNYETE